jgi:hypothetical protein
MTKKGKHKNNSVFTEGVEKKIKEAITKSKDRKLISEPKPKSDKGL